MYFSEKQSRGTEFKIKIQKVLFRKKTKYQLVEIFESLDWGKVLAIDSLFMVTEKDEFFYHESLVHPLLSTIKEPSEVLIIGGGDGGALKEVLKHPVKKIIQVEIDEEVFKACRDFFPWAKKAYKDKRVNLIFEDARDFVKKTKKKFDVIILDTSDPVGPAKVFYTEEFYDNLKKILKRNGGISLQAESPIFHLKIIKRLYNILKKKFKSVFPYLSPMPTYPGGLWLYFLVFKTKRSNLKPIRIPKETKYYNRDIHEGCFKIPEFLKKHLKIL
ncbi:MAG: polyamine aminopropyltransferase [Candidatus Hydrothermales bacterium]